MTKQKRSDTVKTNEHEEEDENEFCLYYSPNQQHRGEGSDGSADKLERETSGLAGHTNDVERVGEEVDTTEFSQEECPGEDDEGELIQIEDSLGMEYCEEERFEVESTAENKHYGTSEVSTDQHLQQEVLNKKINLFHRLHLKGRHHNKLTAADVLQLAHSLQSHEYCAEKELIQTFIQKLLMMNYRARYLKTKENNEEVHNDQASYDSFKQGADSDDFFFNLGSVSNEETGPSEKIHPMDVQMAVFHCADGFLKQLMVTKLSQCQYALPLLVPDPFTQQIEFPLWTFRQINKSWKMRNTNNEAISQTEPIYKAETPMVCFFRFGSVSSSKSQLMNSLINEKHNTYFHRNCPGSSRTRVLMDGVVEITWFCPSGSYDDKFTECVAFCNLHGDAGDHEKQLQILTEMSSVNVVLLPQLQKNDRSMTKLEELYKGSKPLICLFTEDKSAVTLLKKKYKIGLKDRNQSEVSGELRRAIKDCLSESSSTFRLKDVSKHSDIRVDEEDDDDCKRGREAAQQMMSLLEKKDLREIKESFLPHQGKLWHQWSQTNKELHRPKGDEIEMDISRKQKEMKNIREMQHKTDISEFIKFFIKEITSDTGHTMFFIKWLGILLDEYTSADLFVLHHKYYETWSTVLKLKEKHEPEELTVKQSELERISEDLQAAALGLEHIMREIGQIYESCSSVNENKKDLQIHFSSLPSLAAEMMGRDELAGRSTRHHDNELATFVVGLANLTLINIFGENQAEMQEILQIVVQAFMRMKKKSNKMNNDQHIHFKEAIYVEKREEYYSIFQKYCHGATSVAIFGEIICQKLKEPFEQSVYKKTARDLTDEMRTNCESLNGNRSNLEKHILKALAEEEDFDKYMNYIDNPRDHFKSFIRDEVSRYITDKFSVSFSVNVLPKMKENIKLLQQKIMKAAHESTEHVQVNRGDAGLWLKSFTQQLSDELIFSEKDLSGVKHDDVDDFNLLEDVLRNKLPAIISDISSRFNTETFPVKLDCKDRPDELLTDHFCQCCWVQCPFCGAICTNTIVNHDGDHSVPYHRSIGLNGIYTSNLSTHICTSAVASSNLYFYPNDPDDKVLWRDYRRAGGVYADWSITPDLSELPYWKWFVCRFQKDLEKYYKKFEGYVEIPDEWRKYSKQEAIESVNKYL
ncbi:interferon-induced very large GTPase 1-like [Sinocyclocheilus rhinocerous]|uniref:interferon-induced very large GTPase 1-like n=1 Tax=Sinocyclocheilus rhinocerous TaxID=307959 RepID=UPI0007B9C032|nr:PREDICTED: interferon-induced very large GTPase 1-like [Sinocyclocheilus rhinocerous]